MENIYNNINLVLNNSSKKANEYSSSPILKDILKTK